MVVDVKDYKSDEIKVLVTEEDVIVIEGTIERKVGNSTSSKSFKRQFNLPPCVDFTRVTSALSKDGILKIVAPFKVSLFTTLSWVLRPYVRVMSLRLLLLSS